MIVFISNFLNHHQLGLCKELSKYDEFCFIASEPTFSEQKQLGYDDMNTQYDFVLRMYESQENRIKAQELLNTADIVIAGSCSFPFEMIVPRLNENKLTFWFSERLFKISDLELFYPPKVKRVLTQCTKYRKNNFYLLSAGSFVARDYKKLGAFKGKSFSWGYFPPVIQQDLNLLISKKSKKLSILWVARYLKLKRPEMALYVARQLKKADIDFEMKMIGSGILHGKIEKKIKKYGLEDCVKQLGALPFREVRNYMDEAQIFMFTSNRREGWGAVLNESMNSACAVVVGNSIGSAKNLISDGENGILFKNRAQLVNAVKKLSEDCDLRQRMGSNAYETVTGVWGIETAAKRFYDVAQALLNAEDVPDYEFGPMKKEQ